MAAIVELLPAPSLPGKQASHNAQSCPSCGSNVSVDMSELDEAKRRVAELERQMEFLKEKAIAAVDRCTDYEDQIRSLKDARNQEELARPHTSGRDLARNSDEDARPVTAGVAGTRQSRFSFFASRRGSPNNSTSLPPPPPALADVELINELERERSLRAKAEERANKVDSEIEELSVQLFSQANEMVAEERKARAKLEERVMMLEKKDKDKMARLDRLEKAVSRIDRVKAMLSQPGPAVGGGGDMLAPPVRR